MNFLTFKQNLLAINKKAPERMRMCVCVFFENYKQFLPLVNICNYI